MRVKTGRLSGTLESRKRPIIKKIIIVPIICTLIAVYCKNDLGKLFFFGCLPFTILIFRRFLGAVHITLTIKLRSAFNHEFIGF